LTFRRVLRSNNFFSTNLKVIAVCFGCQKGVASMTYELVVHREQCKGCGLCVPVCPKKVLEIAQEVNTKGYFPAYPARYEDCIFCAICCTMCPDLAITIQLKPDAGLRPTTEPAVDKKE
jgi:2-oxoglutarate ferredoxin oxidoreductase subunit delta